VGPDFSAAGAFVLAYYLIAFERRAAPSVA